MPRETREPLVVHTGVRQGRIRGNQGDQGDQGDQVVVEATGARALRRGLLPTNYLAARQPPSLRHIKRKETFTPWLVSGLRSYKS